MEFHLNNSISGNRRDLWVRKARQFDKLLVPIETASGATNGLEQTQRRLTACSPTHSGQQDETGLMRPKKTDSEPARNCSGHIDGEQLRVAAISAVSSNRMHVLDEFEARPGHSLRAHDEPSLVTKSSFFDTAKVLNWAARTDIT